LITASNKKDARAKFEEDYGIPESKSGDFDMDIPLDNDDSIV